MSSKTETNALPGAADTDTAAEYAGPERRDTPADRHAVRGEVRFDAKGNSVWEPYTDVPRRRKDDDTFDLLKCLEVESLSLEDDDDEPVTGAIERYQRDERS